MTDSDNDLLSETELRKWKEERRYFISWLMFGLAVVSMAISLYLKAAGKQRILNLLVFMFGAIPFFNLPGFFVRAVKGANAKRRSGGSVWKSLRNSLREGWPQIVAGFIAFGANAIQIDL